ncbi:MAG: hypothetical protein N2Z72_02055 [Bacteroidales bacterium]|nr:hypothetical protein [Bacteroidales bacterium]
MKQFYLSIFLTLFLFTCMSQSTKKLLEISPYSFFPIKSSQGMIRVLDSTILFTYNSSTLGWDPIRKTYVLSRHWGTDGWPNEMVRYDFEDNTWKSRYLFTWQFFPNQKIEKHVIKAYNSFLESFRDTLVFEHFNGYKDQFNDSILLSTISNYYDFNTNSISGGEKIISHMLTNSQYHEIISYGYNTATGNYDLNNYKISYEYTNNQLLQTKTTASWNASTAQYENNHRILYSYYSTGKIKSLTYQYMSSGVWLNNGKNHYTYNSNGYPETITSYSINSFNEFVPYYKDSFCYSPTGKVTLNYIFRWDDLQKLWVNYAKMSKTYNGDDSIKTVLYENWNGTNWIPNCRGTYTYNAQGKLIQYVEEQYNTITSSWEDVLKFTWQYHVTGQVEEHIIYTGSPLTPQFKETFSYDSYNNLNIHTNFFWDNMSSSWIPNDKLAYYWSDWNANALSEDPDVEITLSPNPVEDICFIRSSLPVCKIDIYNSMGQILLSKGTDNSLSFSFDLSELKPANYFVCFSFTDSSNKKIIRSIIKQ